MAFVKKTWKDRIAEFPTRRRLTKEDNTSELVTVAREEGTLSQEGDAFSAENMNDLESRIDAEFTEVNGNLNEIEGKIDNSIKKINIHHIGTTEVEYTLPQNIGLNDVIICNSSFGGVSGATFVLGGYALYYSAFSTHVAYTIPAPNSTSNATSTVTLMTQNKIKVKCNNANTFCSVTVIMGGNSAN